MNMDKAVDILEAGFGAGHTVIQRIAITDEQREQAELRRKGGKAEAYWVWSVCVGERGQAPIATFLDFKLTAALKKALLWRDVKPTKRTRKPKDGTTAAAPAA